MKCRYFILIIFIWISLLSKEVLCADPLILQLEMPYPRNTKSTTLIFKQKTVEFITNSYRTKQKINLKNKQSVHLGQFSMPIKEKFKLIKQEIEAYKKLLSSRKSLSNDVLQILKIPGRHSQYNPRTSHLQIREGQQSINIRESSPYFTALRDILTEARDNKWTCTLCAKYQKSNNFIVRFVKKQGRKPASTKFTKESLKCYPINPQKIECLDPEFGILEL